MQFPQFFRDVPRLKVRDPLAQFLGAAEDGVLEFGYEDVVKLAGHSCPTVASAYRLTCLALAALYPDEIPERGGVAVEFRNRFEDGVTGVVASVIMLLTGAAQEGGFKGIGGQFVRRELQGFEVELPMAMRFVRLDNEAAVDAEVSLAQVPADPEMSPLMARCVAGEAQPEEQQMFATMWQDRVRRILLEHGDDPRVFRIQPLL